MAVIPPPAVLTELAAIERPERPGLRWTGREQWHVTLRFFASVDPDILVAALKSVSLSGGWWPGGPLMARCGPAPFALSRQVWAVPVTGLDRLAAAVVAATADLAPAEGRPFRGHLTLARARRPGVLSGLPAPPMSYEWAVEQIVAVRSELRADGAHHSVICRRAL